MELPSRRPDVVDVNDSQERVEIWLDEMVDAFYEEPNDKKPSLAEIKFSEEGNILWHDKNKKKWFSYEGMNFPNIKCKVNNFIADKLLLGGHMTEAQKRFVDLDKKKAAYKEFVEEYNKAILALKEEMGIGGHFQDYEGIVYQVDNCDGKFVYNTPLEVKRTRREGERAGTLSMKKAKELGYDVE